MFYNGSISNLLETLSDSMGNRTRLVLADCSSVVLVESF